MRKLISILCLSAIICLLANPFKKPTAEVVQTSPAVEAVEVPTPVIFEPVEVVEVPTPVIFEPVETPQPWTHEEVVALAKMLWGEARGIPSETEQAACVWCVLNRVDQGYGSILEVVTAPSQFVGYRENNPIDETLWLLCEDVLTRWQREKDGEIEVGRVLPPDYMWFSGDSKRNHFRNAYKNGTTWDWSLPSPYED